MRKLKLSLIALAFSLPQSATAQDSTLRVVPVEKAPFHITAFRNEYVRMLNVHVPPGRTASIAPTRSSRRDSFVAVHQSVSATVPPFRRQSTSIRAIGSLWTILDPKKSSEQGPTLSVQAQ
jgi:hypothetical protein